MKKLNITFRTLDTDDKTIKNYEWSELYSEITNTFTSLLGSPKDSEVKRYKEKNQYLGEFNMKSKTLTWSVNWNEELIVENILKLGDALDWNLEYEIKED